MAKGRRSTHLLINREQIVIPSRVYLQEEDKGLGVLDDIDIA